MAEEARGLLHEDLQALQPPWLRVQLAAYAVAQVVSLLRQLLTTAPEQTLDALEKLAILVKESAAKGEPCEGFREAVGVAKNLPTTASPVHNPACQRGHRSVGSAVAQAILAAAEAVLNPSSGAPYTAYENAVYAARNGSLGAAVEEMHQEFARLLELRKNTVERKRLGKISQA